MRNSSKWKNSYFNDEKTWVRVKTDKEFEKELIKFVANYKETIIKQKIQTIDKDFV